MTETLILEELPYWSNSAELFEKLLELPGAAFFDSVFAQGQRGRYDILTACPLETELPQLRLNADEAQSRQFFEEMSRFHLDHYGAVQTAAPDIPFCGGILGYLEYEAGNGLHKLPGYSDNSLPQPHSTTGLQAYEWAIIQDHLLQKSVLVALPRVSSKRRNELMARLGQSERRQRKPFSLPTPFISNLTETQYKKAFEKIQRYIGAGDCYQVNLAQRFNAPYQGDPWLAYKKLRVAAAAPFSAYISLPDNSAVMSLSPERFISLHGQHVETAPIKGTRARHPNIESDKIFARELQASEKDRAENLMIVDLMRNDLGRSCVPGSIHVDRLFELQSFTTVHHLISTISGELRQGRSAWELLRDSFPGGSITGAPKRRAMEVIAELEPHARRAYCGSMLYVSADGRMDSNIAIRTLLCAEQQIYCWGGGGIVADSQWQLEYQETFDKVGKFLQLLQTI